MRRPKDHVPMVSLLASGLQDYEEMRADYC